MWWGCIQVIRPTVSLSSYSLHLLFHLNLQTSVPEWHSAWDTLENADCMSLLGQTHGHHLGPHQFFSQFVKDLQRVIQIILFSRVKEIHWPPWCNKMTGITSANSGEEWCLPLPQERMSLICQSIRCSKRKGPTTPYKSYKC